MSEASADTPPKSRASYSRMSTGASTPRGAYADGLGSPKLSGAEIYARFMEAAFQRRQKKGQPAYCTDAAGVTTEMRVGSAKRIQHKGRGNPPPDDYYPPYKPTKRFIPGRSFTVAADLLTHDPHSEEAATSAILDTVKRSAESGAAGARTIAYYVPRPCLKMTENSLHDSMQGASLKIVIEAPPKRPLRRPGTAQPRLDTKSRVMHVEAAPAGQLSLSSSGAESMASGASTPQLRQASSKYLVSSFGVLPSAANSPKDAVLSFTWARQMYEAGLTQDIPQLCERPSTAPSFGKQTEAHKRYHEMSVANADVFCYRHSGGICPTEYKLDATRMASPHLVKASADAAREAYYDARSGYATNRVRSILSARPRYA